MADSIMLQQPYSNGGLAALNQIAQANKQNTDLKFSYYNYASVYNRIIGNHTSAKDYADSMLAISGTISQQPSLVKGRALAYIRKADVLYATGQYKNCYYYYSLGSVEAGKLHNPVIDNEINGHLSLFLYEEGNYDSAIFYFKQLLKGDAAGDAKTYDVLVYNQGVLDNIGVSFLKEQQPDRALIYFNQALASISKAEALRPQQKEFCQLASGIVYGNMAQAHQQQGNFLLAEAMYKKSIAINRQPGNAIENALITQQQLANLYYRQRNLPALRTVLWQMKSGMDTIPNKKVEIQWNYLMSRYYSAVNDPPAALAYINRYLTLKEDANTTQPLMESDIFKEISLMQSNHDLAISEKNSQIKGIFLLSGGFILLLTIAITLQFFGNLKKTRKNLSIQYHLNEKVKTKKSELEEAMLELEARNSEKRRILYIVAHDLRSPISAINALTTLIQDDYENEEINRESLAMIKTICTNNNELINSLLEVAENESVTYQYEAVNINELLSRLMEVLRMKAKEKNQSIDLITVPDTTLITADPSKINRLITNLVVNAIKFSSSGSRIRVSTWVCGKHVGIQVKDYGIGIPRKYHTSLFNTFTDAKRPGTAGEKTFGLGLSICKQIVEKHQGKIWFESVENKGTTFFIEFKKRVAESMETSCK